MDPRVYGGARSQGQGQRGNQGDLFAQKGKQEDLFAQRGKQEDLFAQRGKQENLFAQRGKEEDLFAQKAKPEDLFAQRTKQENTLGQRAPQQDLFAQRGKQEDLFTQRGTQEEPFAGNKRSAETSLRGQDEPQRRQKESYGESNRQLSDAPDRGQAGRDAFGRFSSGYDSEAPLPPPLPYSSVASEVELHGQPGLDVMHNPAMQTMVKMVTMLNFMKVSDFPHPEECESQPLITALERKNVTGRAGETKTLRSKEQWRAAGAEFVGTLLFVYIGCGSVVASGMLDIELTPERLIAIAIAHGLAITFLAGATGAISGGHLNPAVTLAFVVAGKENLVRAGLYVSAQILGAIFGAVLLKASTPEEFRGTLGSHDINENIFTSQGFLMEMVLTFVLVFVIFGVAVDRRGPGVIAPLPIGFAVLADHLVGVPFTGASMNPARSFGPALVSGYFGRAHLVYWTAPCFGATAAAALYRYAFLEPAEAAARAAVVTPR